MSNLVRLSDSSRSIERDIPERKNTFQTDRDVIELSWLLNPPQFRGRFIAYENAYPALTQKIDAYKRRVQHALTNIASENFDETLKIIHSIAQIVLTTRYEPEYESEYLFSRIKTLNKFECQYFLNAINYALFPEEQTYLISTTRHLFAIREILYERMEEIDQP